MNLYFLDVHAVELTDLQTIAHAEDKILNDEGWFELGKKIYLADINSFQICARDKISCGFGIGVQLPATLTLMNNKYEFVFITIPNVKFSAWWSSDRVVFEYKFIQLEYVERLKKIKNGFFKFKFEVGADILTGTNDFSMRKKQPWNYGRGTAILDYSKKEESKDPIFKIYAHASFLSEFKGEIVDNIGWLFKHKVKFFVSINDISDRKLEMNLYYKSSKNGCLRIQIFR